MNTSAIIVSELGQHGRGYTLTIIRFDKNSELKHITGH